MRGLHPILAPGLSALAIALARVALAASTTHEPPPGSDSHLCDVRAFGARGDGVALDTRSIQAALDACARAHGGVVRFPAGRYVSGTLVGASHITLALDPGATLVGSRDVADYRMGAEFGLSQNAGVDQAGEGLRAGLIVFRNVEDVHIVGPGTIDGQGLSFMDQKPHLTTDFDPAKTRNPDGEARAMRDLRYGPIETKASGRPGVPVLFFHARNVGVSGLTITNSPNWTLVFQDVDRLVVHDLHIVNSALIPNNDGIDCNQCRDAHFSDFDIETGDDGFSFGNSRDVTVTNGSLRSRSAAIRLESTLRATFSNLTIDSNRGLAIFASRWSLQPTDGAVFSGIVLRTRLIPGHWWGKAEPIYIAVQPCAAGRPCRGGVRNVTFSDIDAEAEAGAVLAGAAGLPIAGVTLSDVRLRMIAPDPQIASDVGGDFDRRWTAATPAEGIVKHDIPAIFASDVDNLTLRNVEVNWVPALPDYATEALAVSRFRDVSVDGLRERGAAPPRASALAFSDGEGLDVRRLRAAPGRPPMVLQRVAGAQTADR